MILFAVSTAIGDLSTPSLGITERLEWPDRVLSTPSLGIITLRRFSRTPFRIIVRDHDFQLPLSGSPSPIPGFSGSPRLSAAAPLRTNDS
jgi:hypothetical protein